MTVSKHNKILHANQKHNFGKFNQIDTGISKSSLTCSSSAQTVLGRCQWRKLSNPNRLQFDCLGYNAQSYPLGKTTL